MMVGYRHGQALLLKQMEAVREYSGNLTAAGSGAERCSLPNVCLLFASLVSSRSVC